MNLFRLNKVLALGGAALLSVAMSGVASAQTLPTITGNEQLQQTVPHLPSRTRSLLWILSSLEPMAAHGLAVADDGQVRAAMMAKVPQRQASPRVASA